LRLEGTARDCGGGRGVRVRNEKAKEDSSLEYLSSGLHVTKTETLFMEPTHVL